MNCDCRVARDWNPVAASRESSWELVGSCLEISLAWLRGCARRARFVTLDSYQRVKHVAAQGLRGLMIRAVLAPGQHMQFLGHVLHAPCSSTEAPSALRVAVRGKMMAQAVQALLLASDPKLVHHLLSESQHFINVWQPHTHTHTHSLSLSLSRARDHPLLYNCANAAVRFACAYSSDHDDKHTNHHQHFHSWTCLVEHTNIQCCAATHRSSSWQWSCPVCTLLQNGGDECSACGGARPGAFAVQKPWVCQSCTVRNPASVANCETCTMPRPDPTTRFAEEVRSVR